MAALDDEESCGVCTLRLYWTGWGAWAGCMALAGAHATVCNVHTSVRGTVCDTRPIPLWCATCAFLRAGLGTTRAHTCEWMAARVAGFARLRV